MIELLLGAAIFAMVALTLFAIFANGVHLHNRVRQTGVLYEEARAITDILSADLENMVAYHFPPAHEQGYSGSFSGDQTSLTLLRPSATGLERISYFLSCAQPGHVHELVRGQKTSGNIDVVLVNTDGKGRDQCVLSRKEEAFGLPEQDSKTAIVSDHIPAGGLNFSYARNDPSGGDSLAWAQDWSESYLPAAVRLEAELNDPALGNNSVVIHKNFLVPIAIWGKQSF